MGKAQKLKQQKKEEEQRKAEEQHRRSQRKLKIIAIVVGALVLVGAITALTWTLWPQSYKYQEMVLETSKGEIRVELLSDAAPSAVQRMSQLVNEGFYTGIRFHRVEDALVQAGDPKSKDPDATNLGSGGSGKKFANEIDFNTPGFADDINNYFQAEGVEVGRAVLEAGAAEQGETVDQLIAQIQTQGQDTNTIMQSWSQSGLDYNQALASLYSKQGYTYESTTQSALMGEGIVALANAGPQPIIGSDGQPQTDANGQYQWDSNINDSQFFVIKNYDTSNLVELLWRYKHTVFGRVVSGMDVVNQLQTSDTIDQATIYTQTRHR